MIYCTGRQNCSIICSLDYKPKQKTFTLYIGDIGVNFFSSRGFQMEVQNGKHVIKWYSNIVEKIPLMKIKYSRNSIVLECTGHYRSWHKLIWFYFF